MPRIETTVAKGYGKHFGGKVAYLRELIANGLDSQTRNQHNGSGCFDMTFRNGTLTLTNWGVKVSTSALLMGTSESREDTSCIGQFGEGLVMALKGLTEMGNKVEIFNRDEKWRPAIEPSRNFDGAEVLVVHTRRCDDRGGFIVKVKGLEREDYEKAQGLFLSRHPDFDESQTASGYYGKAEVLLQPEFKGKVYNKGVFLLERDDLMFGYNLHEEDSINRDRSLMSDYDLKQRTLDVLDEAVSEDESFREKLVQMMFVGTHELEMRATYSSLRYQTKFRNRLCDAFSERYGTEATPVSDDEEAQEARSYGLRGIVCPPTLLDVLTGGSYQSLHTIRQELANEVQEATPCITEAQTSCLELAEYLLEKGGWVTPKLRIVVFGGDDIKARAEGGEILVAKHVVESGMPAVLQCLLEVRCYEDDPRSLDRLQRSVKTLASVIATMWGDE